MMSFWFVPFKIKRAKTTLFWTQKKIKLGLLSPSPLQPDDNWRREGEKEEEGEGEGEWEEGAYLARGESGNRVAPCAPT